MAFRHTLSWVVARLIVAAQAKASRCMGHFDDVTNVTYVCEDMARFGELLLSSELDGAVYSVFSFSWP